MVFWVQALVSYVAVFSECARPNGTDLESSLVLFSVLAVYLLHRTHIIFEIGDGMLPCLQAFGQQSGGLGTGVSSACLRGHNTGFSAKSSLTLVGSKSGTASSLMMLMLVPARDGMSIVVGDVAEAMMTRSLSWHLDAENGVAGQSRCLREGTIRKRSEWKEPRN